MKKVLLPEDLVKNPEDRIYHCLAIACLFRCYVLLYVWNKNSHVSGLDVIYEDNCTALIFRCLSTICLLREYQH